MRPRRRPLLLLSLVLLLACSCGGSDDGDSAESTAAASTAVTAIPDKTIVIDNFDFAPETLQVRVGDTVTVDNRDASEHTVTATDKSFDTGTLPTGKTTFTVTKAGRFEYVCEIHPFMPRRVIQVSA